MSAARKTETETPTPEARRERAKRAIAEAVVELVEAAVEQRTTGGEHYNQRTSPLKKRRYLELARKKKFPSIKHGQDVLVLKSDMHAYLEREGLARGQRIEDDDVDGIIDAIVTGGPK